VEFITRSSIDWPNSDPAKQPYYLYRARAYELKGEDDPLNALSEYTEGKRHQEEGHYQASIAAYQNSMNLDPAFAWAPNNLAWPYATCIEARVRSGSKAVQYATIACKISKWHCWSFIDTLSAGYAEDGDFDNAVKYAQKALTLAPRENQDNVQENIKWFRARKPLHLNF
jgi:tetratricopeptide (TPR) repeat protein